MDGAENRGAELQQAGRVLDIRRGVARDRIASRMCMGQFLHLEKLLRTAWIRFVRRVSLTESLRKGLGDFSRPSQGYLLSVLEVLCYVRVLGTKLLVSWRFPELLVVPGKTGFWGAYFVMRVRDQQASQHP